MAMCQALLISQLLYYSIIVLIVSSFRQVCPIKVQNIAVLFEFPSLAVFQNNDEMYVYACNNFLFWLLTVYSSVVSLVNHHVAVTPCNVIDRFHNLLVIHSGLVVACVQSPRRIFCPTSVCFNRSVLSLTSIPWLLWLLGNLKLKGNKVNIPYIKKEIK